MAKCNLNGRLSRKKRKQQKLRGLQPTVKLPWDHVDVMREELKKQFPNLTDEELTASGL